MTECLGGTRPALAHESDDAGPVGRDADRNELNALSRELSFDGRADRVVDVQRHGHRLRANDDGGHDAS